ncbi:MAG: DNRLRE domain-containing protein [Planctomycetota bacterium]|jgi:hypothetical protein
MRISPRTFSPAAVLAAALAPALWAACPVQLGASRDATMYAESGSLGNGAGEHLFAGQNGLSNARRGLIAFDVAGAVPAGSTITSARLILHVSQTQAGDRVVRLHRATTAWGEGSSNAPGGEGGGTTATGGDATWTHAVLATTPWGTAGGDFAGVASATAVVGGIDYYFWGPTPQMATDAQGWLENPGGPDGWILLGDESQASTAKRFDSRTNPTASLRPILQLTYIPECPQDTDRNGEVDVTDLLDVLGSWGSCKFGTCCDADTDGDGLVNVNDLLDVLGVWGPC